MRSKRLPGLYGTGGCFPGSHQYPPRHVRPPSLFHIPFICVCSSPQLNGRLLEVEVQKGKAQAALLPNPSWNSAQQDHALKRSPPRNTNHSYLTVQLAISQSIIAPMLPNP